MKTSLFVAVRHSFGWFLVFSAVVAVLVPARASAYTPESPEVQSMLARGIAYLEKADRNGEHSARVGGQCMMGLAAYKYDKRFGGGGEPLPSLTQLALTRTLGLTRNPRSLGNESNYSLGIMLIFLTEVHPENHMAEIQACVDEVLRRQKANGAWGYDHEKRGDTSQLQYAVLGLWAAKKVAQVEVDNKVMDGVVNYLIRVQDPSGGFGYQGNDPGGFTRVPQTDVRHSLCAAGLGSVYVAADFYEMSQPEQVEKKSLPPALMPVLKDRKEGRLADSSVEIGRMRVAMNDGDNWFRQNFRASVNLWPFYYLYGLERYQSFKEIVEGTYEKEPRWYNEGIRALQKFQAKDGSFGTQVTTAQATTGCDPPVATAFACLFMLRSTRETIAQVVDRDGILHGGQGLPSDLSEVRLRGTKIVAPTVEGTVNDLLQMLEDDEAEKIESMLDNPDALSLEGMTGTGEEYKERLVRILRNGSYKARIVAARTLGRQGDLDNVPILIYALTDGDHRVMIEARNGLRLTSRKFDGFGLSDKPAKGEARSAAEAWKGWYRSVRPDAVFLQ